MRGPRVNSAGQPMNSPPTRFRASVRQSPPRCGVDWCPRQGYRIWDFEHLGAAGREIFESEPASNGNFRIRRSRTAQQRNRTFGLQYSIFHMRFPCRIGGGGTSPLPSTNRFKKRKLLLFGKQRGEDVFALFVGDAIDL